MERKEGVLPLETRRLPEGYEPPRVEAAKTGDDLGREALMALVSNG